MLYRLAVPFLSVVMLLSGGSALAQGRPQARVDRDQRGVRANTMYQGQSRLVRDEYRGHWRADRDWGRYGHRGYVYVGPRFYAPYRGYVYNPPTYYYAPYYGPYAYYPYGYNYSYVPYGYASYPDYGGLNLNLQFGGDWDED